MFSCNRAGFGVVDFVVDVVDTVVGVLWVLNFSGPDLQFMVPDVAVLCRSFWGLFA